MAYTHSDSETIRPSPVAPRRAREQHAVDEADEDRHTALHWECDAGHVATARCLLDAGAAPDAQNADGSTPLHMACACEHL